MRVNKIIYICLLFIMTILLIGCSGSNSENADKKVTGTFVDAPVAGLNYICSPSGITGITNNSGEYTCNENDLVTFKLGDSLIGTVEAKEAVTSPYDIFPNDQTSAINLARLLQTIDSDPTDDIITPKLDFIEKLPNSYNFSLLDEEFENIIENHIGDILISSQQAEKNMFESVSAFGGVTRDPITYSWQVEEWSNCTKDCSIGNALQTRNVQCISSKNKIVNDINCIEKKPKLTQSCTTTICNQKPVANAGDDIKIDINSIIRLDGSKSHDPDGSSLIYSWKLISKPETSSANLGNINFKNPILTPDIVGFYTAQLVVSDGLEESSVSNVNIQVMNLEALSLNKTCNPFDNLPFESSIKDMIPSSLFDNFPSANSTYKDAGFEVRNCGDLTLYTQYDPIFQNYPVRTILHIDKDIQPSVVSPLMAQFDQSILTDTLIYTVSPTFGIDSGKDSSGTDITWPAELKTVIDKTYDDSGSGGLSLKEGSHITGLVTIKGIIASTLSLMNYPSDNIIMTTGAETPSASWQTLAEAKKDSSTDPNSSFKDGFKPTPYIELAHSGLWEDSTGIEGLDLIDTTVYIDADSIGFWGTGNFNNTPISMFYNGPFKLTANIDAYTGAQIGFGAEEMTLEKYIQFNAAYQSRYKYIAEQNGAPNTSLFGDWLNTGLGKLPLDILKIRNEKIASLNFKSGDSFPALENFNLVILGPTATSQDGTNGPLLKINGDTYFFNKKFGDINLTASASGLSSTTNGNMSFGLGTFQGINIGNFGGNVSLAINADENEESMKLNGTIQTGPFPNVPLSLNLSNNQINYSLPGGCALPFSVNAFTNLSSITNPTDLTNAWQLNGGSFQMPSPSSLLACSANLYGMLKDGILYLAGPAGEYIELAVGLIPSEITDLTNSTTGFVFNTATDVLNSTPLKDLPLPNLSSQFSNVAGPVVTAILENEAFQAAQVIAERVMGETIGRLTTLITNPGEFLSGITSAITGIGNAISCWFDCANFSPAEIDMFWEEYKDFPIGLLDVSAGHNGDIWIIYTTGGDIGYPAQPNKFIDDKGIVWYGATPRENGLFDNLDYPFPGFVKIEGAADGSAVAIDKKGRLWTYNAYWRLTKHFATDVGLGGSYIWITSTEDWYDVGYKIYRAPYTAGTTNFNFEFMNGGATKIDVGSDGRAWVINKNLDVYEGNGYTWNVRGHSAIDISVSASNRAWITSAASYAVGGGQIFTYEPCREDADIHTGPFCNYDLPFWRLGKGHGIYIAAGKGDEIWTIGRADKLYSGRGKE